MIPVISRVSSRPVKENRSDPSVKRRLDVMAGLVPNIDHLFRTKATHGQRSGKDSTIGFFYRALSGNDEMIEKLSDVDGFQK